MKVNELNYCILCSFLFFTFKVYCSRSISVFYFRVKFVEELKQHLIREKSFCRSFSKCSNKGTVPFLACLLLPVEVTSSFLLSSKILFCSRYLCCTLSLASVIFISNLLSILGVKPTLRHPILCLFSICISLSLIVQQWNLVFLFSIAGQISFSSASHRVLLTLIYLSTYEFKPVFVSSRKWQGSRVMGLLF